jgi:tetratricopeptide (TPR) repeat protein
LTVAFSALSYGLFPGGRTAIRVSGVSVVTRLLVAVALLTIQAQAAQGPPRNPANSAAFHSATLEGLVRDSSGRPLAGAAVYLQVKDGVQTLSAHSDAAGSYRFSGLAEGIYMLRVEMAGFSQATIGPCVVGPKEAKRLDLTLESSKASPAQATAPGQRAPEFFDEPQFTVAGVTDGTNLGGHGSNTIVRTKESLAKDIASLSASETKTSTGSSPPGSSAPVDPAEASLRATAEREPGDFDANHRLGQLLVDRGKPQESLVYLERASHLKPDDYDNAYLLALAYADAGQYQQARTHARALLTLQENARQGLAQPNQALLHHLLGDIEEKLGDPLEGVREYQRAAELGPTESNFFDWGSELLLHRAAEPAIEVFSQGNRLFPQSARMLVALGVAWYSNGSYDRAAQRLCEASDLNPGDLEPYLFLGKIQSVETNQSECSGERLKRFVRLQPANALANYYYGVNLWKRRKGPDDAASATQAESLLKRAVELDPTLGVGYLQLGVLYSERRDFSRAIASYQDAVRVSPELEEAHYRLAQAYKRTGEKAKAEEELQLYNQISKSKDEEVERERRESRQFVYTLRSPRPEAESR